MSEPLIRRGEETFAMMHLLVGMELLSAWERPLGNTSRMRAEAWSVSDMPHVTEEQILIGVTQMQFRLDTAVIHITLGKTIADQNNALAFGWWCHCLRAGAGSSGWLSIWRMRRLFGSSFSFGFLFTRQASRRAFTRGEVARLQFDLLVIVTLQCGIHRWFEGINDVHVSLGWHFATQQVQRGIDDESAEIFIGKIDGGSHGGAEGFASALAIWRLVFKEPSQRLHRFVFRSLHRIGSIVQRLRHSTAQEDSRFGQIQVLDRINIAGAKDLLHAL